MIFNDFLAVDVLVHEEGESGALVDLGLELYVLLGRESRHQFVADREPHAHAVPVAALGLVQHLQLEKPLLHLLCDADARVLHDYLKQTEAFPYYPLDGQGDAALEGEF